jgi:hypothetical protein
MKPIGTPRDAIRPNEFFVEAIVNSATGSKESFIEIQARSASKGLFDSPCLAPRACEGLKIHRGFNPVILAV